MTWIEKIALTLGMVVFMECFAWATHKYVMHGWGWGWHRSHHRPRSGPVEKNDLYALCFAVAVVGMFVAGMWLETLWWAALGITLYGAIYVFVHDMLVHQRFGLRWIPRQGYLKRLQQAHRLHHAVKQRKGAVSFGFLLARSPVRLKAELRRGLSNGSIGP